MARYDLTDFEWRVFAPLLPNKPRGVCKCPRCAGRCAEWSACGSSVFWTTAPRLEIQGATRYN